MTRADFSKKTLIERFAYAEGRCEWVEPETGIRCYAVLKPGGWHGDHDLPDRMGGKNDFANCRCLCLYHHDIKTSQIDAPRIAKTRRQEFAAVAPAQKSKMRGPSFHKAPPQRRASKPLNKPAAWRGTWT